MEELESLRTLTTLGRQKKLLHPANEEVIGRGSYGTVSITDDPEIVCKTIDTEDIDTFIKEVHIIKKLSPHPNIISLLDTDNSDGKVEIRMKKYVPLEQCKMQCDFSILKILLDISNGLRHCHSNNIIHRDLKRNNILLKLVNGVIKRAIICDFGMAVSSNSKIMSSHVISLKSRPPEIQKNFYNDYQWTIGMRYKRLNLGRCLKNISLKDTISSYGCEVDVWGLCMTMISLICDKFTTSTFAEFVMKQISSENHRIHDPGSDFKICIDDDSRSHSYSDSSTNARISDFEKILIRKDFQKNIIQFVKKHVNKNIIFLKFYIHVIRKCLVDPKKRITANSLYNVIADFIEKTIDAENIREFGLYRVDNINIRTVDKIATLMNSCLLKRIKNSSSSVYKYHKVKENPRSTLVLYQQIMDKYQFTDDHSKFSVYYLAECITTDLEYEEKIVNKIMGQCINISHALIYNIFFVMDYCKRIGV